MTFDAIAPIDEKLLATELRLRTHSLLSCTCCEERRQASIQLRETALLLKGAGKTEAVWKEAANARQALLIWNHQLREDEEEEEVIEGAKFHRQLGKRLCEGLFSLKMSGVCCRRAFYGVASNGVIWAPLGGR